MTSIARFVNTMPVPIFGTVRTAGAFITAKARTLPRFAGWIAPLGAGVLWFVWPAIDDSWKISIGIKADPEVTKAASSELAKTSKLEEEEKKVAELPQSAMSEVETAHKYHSHDETDSDKLLKEAAKSGDFSYLEDKWELFLEKATNPGEDDDDEEEEEEEEESHEEEEGDESEQEDDE